ncbi:MAG TPA: histidine kinase [Chryseosolibacter sp.]
MATYQTKYFEMRWVKDFIFCAAAYFVLLSIFAGSSEWRMIDHIYTSIFLGTLILFGTINEWVIQKHFLKNEKYIVFLILTCLNIMAGALFNYILFDKLIDLILPNYYFISYYHYGDLLKFFFVYIFLLTLLDLSWEWFQFQEARHRVTILEKEKVNAELKALMNQVNPHFLFNSLTVLYGLALKGSSETAEAVLKLSDTLRYVIYESARGKVNLSSEINLIKNYIELQRYRIKGDAKITFNHDVLDDQVKIEPMLLLPLVENSFKHGMMGDGTNEFIMIDLYADDKKFRFRIANNKGIAPSVEQPGGIGLKNIEDRLKLVYGPACSFRVEQTDNIFTVHLNITVA